jgi:hypothetical protein
MGYGDALFEEVLLLVLGVRVEEIGGEGRLAWKCLSSLVVNDNDIVAQTISWVNGGLGLLREVWRLRHRESGTGVPHSI